MPVMKVSMAGAAAQHFTGAFAGVAELRLRVGMSVAFGVSLELSIVCTIQMQQHIPRCSAVHAA